MVIEQLKSKRGNEMIEYEKLFLKLTKNILALSGFDAELENVDVALKMCKKIT